MNEEDLIGKLDTAKLTIMLMLALIEKGVITQEDVEAQDEKADATLREIKRIKGAEFDAEHPGVRELSARFDSYLGKT